MCVFGSPRSDCLVFPSLKLRLVRDKAQFVASSSGAFSRAITTTAGITTTGDSELDAQVSQEAMDSVRQAYLEVFDLTSDPAEQLRLLAEIGAQTVQSVLATASSSFSSSSSSSLTENKTEEPGERKCPTPIAASGQSLRLLVNKKLHTFATVGKPVLLGRLQGCDVRLPSNNHFLSRLHAVIVPLPTLGLTMVADIGSANGLSLQSHEASAALPEPSAVSSSSSDASERRRILLLGHGKSAVLTLLPNFLVVVEPRECVVCLEKPRAVTFQSCHHFAVCHDCARKLAGCPLCQQPIHGAVTDLQVQTCVGNRVAR